MKIGRRFPSAASSSSRKLTRTYLRTSSAESVTSGSCGSSLRRIGGRSTSTRYSSRFTLGPDASSILLNLKSPSAPRFRKVSCTFDGGRKLTMSRQCLRVSSDKTSEPAAATFAVATRRSSKALIRGSYPESWPRTFLSWRASAEMAPSHSNPANARELNRSPLLSANKRMIALGTCPESITGDNWQCSDPRRLSAVAGRLQEEWDAYGEARRYVFRALLTVQGDIVRVGDHLGADEAALEVGVDHSRRLRRRGADGDGPGAHFLRSGNTERR